MAGLIRARAVGDQRRRVVERAASLHRLAARPVTFITYDTGQAMRARRAGVTVPKLEHASEEVRSQSTS